MAARVDAPCLREHLLLRLRRLLLSTRDGEVRPGLVPHRMRSRRRAAARGESP